MADQQPVTLHGGSYDGETVLIYEPVPRYGYFQYGTEQYVFTTMDSPPWEADYVDVTAPPEDDLEYQTEGPAGETGPAGPPGPEGEQGEQGDPGPTMEFRGDWDAGTAYQIMDTVRHEGALYVSVVDTNEGQEPPHISWSLAAVDGTVGATGPTGATGPAGPQGPPGLNNGVYSDLWVWTTKTADANTTSQIGVNAATWAAATVLNLNEKTKDNRDISTILFPRIATGDQFYLQHKTDATRHAYYTVSGTPTDQGTWWSVPVTFTAGNGTVPGGSTDTNVSLLKLGAAANSVPVQDEGADLTTRARLNFVGTGVTATDDSANDRTLVTISGGALPARQTTVLTTSSLAANAVETGTVTLAIGYRILRVQTSRAARVRLYTTAAKRTADAARPATDDPEGDHGCVVEVVTDTSLLELDLSPVPQGYNMETTPTNQIPYHVQNLGTTGTVAVTFTWQQQE